MGVGPGAGAGDPQAWEDFISPEKMADAPQVGRVEVLPPALRGLSVYPSEDLARLQADIGRLYERIEERFETLIGRLGRGAGVPRPGALPHLPVMIYALLDPLTLEVRYIGQTVNLKARMQDHRSRKDNAPERNAWIELLHETGEAPLVEILEEVEADHAVERERWWIDHYRAAGAQLFNVRDPQETLPSRRRVDVARPVGRGAPGPVLSLPPSKSTRWKVSLPTNLQTLVRDAAKRRGGRPE